MSLSATHPACRLSALPHQLNVLLHARLASTSSQLYPFPTHSRPTPHQIFHLPMGASQKDIKARYYDLVRYHHPDSPHCRSLPPEVRHSHFQAITAAYDALRGKSTSSSSSSSGFASAFDPYQQEVLRRKRYQANHHNRRAEYEQYYASQQEWTANADDRWKDTFLVVIGVLTLTAGIVPSLFFLPDRLDQKHRAAVFNLNQARSEAREFGEERRNELRKRVQEIKMQNEAEIDTRSIKDATEPRS